MYKLLYWAILFWSFYWMLEGCLRGNSNEYYFLFWTALVVISLDKLVYEYFKSDINEQNN